MYTKVLNALLKYNYNINIIFIMYGIDYVNTKTLYSLK